jgi:mannose-6-phosphate isomerase class I
LDFPKDLAQEYARRGKVSNFGEIQTPPFEQFYKRAYFIEWPALNRLKRRLLPELNLFIDVQNIDLPTSMSGTDFRSTLHLLSESPFRVRPWFFPGPWGGKFMQGHMDLDNDQPNLAWSYELIVPENGIVLQKEEERLEFSFDFLMFLENQRVLGHNAANQFKFEWPLRLDYLDTVDGGDLSTQVHPKPDYIRKEFGETYTQDESYYIITAKPDAKVYIGLTESCNPEEFQNALQSSILHGTKVDIEKYVNSEPSKPHDLFLIPNGTVHCSGAGNLVLEISATPYIFTFKIYDYVRRDLEGQLRPINLAHGFQNIRFERRKKWVRENLLAKPELVDEGTDWKKYKLYDSPFTFYSIYRVDFESEYETNTNGNAYAVNLVEGEYIEILAQNNRTIELSYIESMIIPAATGKIKMINKGSHACKLVLVCVKPGIGIIDPLNTPQDG